MEQLNVEEVKKEQCSRDGTLEFLIDANLKKKRKRNKNKSGVSKKSLFEEINEKRNIEQQEARNRIKNEIAKREKLLQKIDMVLDCKANEAKLAQDQQESLKDLCNLTSESGSSKVPEQGLNQPILKIEQVIAMTKLELKNAHSHQEYVGRLEKELNKVKENKNKYFEGDVAGFDQKFPEHIEKLSKEIKDFKDIQPRKKEELLKEIESRDVLMTEISKVLDNTKKEIEKVHKQQKIIANLESTLHKIKENEIGEKLKSIGKEFHETDNVAHYTPLATISPSASLLDTLLANVSKLKEAQGQMQKPNENKHDLESETLRDQIKENMTTENLPELDAYMINAKSKQIETVSEERKHKKSNNEFKEKQMSRKENIITKLKMEKNDFEENCSPNIFNKLSPQLSPLLTVKPSMADILKNAPDYQQDAKTNNDLIRNMKKETLDNVKNYSEFLESKQALIENLNVDAITNEMCDSIIVVQKSDTNENDFKNIASKNVRGSGFVSPVRKNDKKPLTKKNRTKLQK